MKRITDVYSLRIMGFIKPFMEDYPQLMEATDWTCFTLMNELPL